MSTPSPALRSDLQARGRSRTDYLTKPGTLAIVRPAGGADVDVAAADPETLEPFVVVEADGTVTAFNGHVDLGTGIRTALAQIVAEELDLGFARVAMVLGDTALTPDQGPTIASETIQITAPALRSAAAQARHFLLARAAERLGADVSELCVDDGVVSRRPATTGDSAGQAGAQSRGDNRYLTYGDLIGDDVIRLALAENVPVKPVEQHRIVGRSQPRVDLPHKATGGLVYVHDMRVPGMLHGRVVRPPYAGVDAGDFVGSSLIGVNERSIAHIPGIVAVVVQGDFIGIVAEREEQADAALRALAVKWKPTPTLPDLSDLASAITKNPSTPRVLLDQGDVDSALENVAVRAPRTYTWPYHMHGSIGPSCALADVSDGRVTAWSGTQNPIPLRNDLARLLDMPVEAVEIVRMEASGCYGRNCADDVTADAALLSKAVGRPVRVQLTRDQEHLWEPKGAGQVMTVDGGLDADGRIVAYDFQTRYPSNVCHTLPLLLTGKVPPTPVVAQMGDRTAIGPYDYENKRVVCHDMAPIVRASWLRGVSALPNSFAHECWIDEMAEEAGVDPVEYRLRYLKDSRAIDLVNQLAERAEWEPHVGPRKREDEAGILRGRGFAYALYVHSKFPGYGSAWAAWVADVAVNKHTGEVSLTKVSVGQDSGLMINPDGVRHQIQGNVIQSTSRVLKEEVTFSDIAVASREWGSYPLLTFPELPPIDVMMVPRPNEPPLGVGESASVPSAAAIANAIYDATGVRFREPPFTPDRVLAALRAAGVSPQADAPALAPPPAVTTTKSRKKVLMPLIAAALGAIGSLGVTTLPWRSAIPPIAPPDPSVFSAATIARGEQLAKLGACFVCHTAKDGAPLAGGLAIDTPFGTIWSTNITPDPDTGLGRWSYPAFVRAMREGLHRDGRHLYPAFPYTSYAKSSDADLQALYAFLMSVPPVRNSVPEPAFGFPFKLRPLMAVWNTMFHDATPFAPDPTKSETWNRGAYLAEGLGHCSACHTPRNAMGAEETGAAHFSGGEAEGWHAPALTSKNPAPLAWDETALYDYLRTGWSSEHGVAAGPMAPIVAELKVFPDADIRAMAHYIASYTDAPPRETIAAQAKTLEEKAAARLHITTETAGGRLFAGACAVCHEQGRGPALFGVKPSLALATAVHAETPDTLLRVMLEGISVPDLDALGAMPSFLHHLDDGQLAALARYVRARFAPDLPAWTGLEATAATIRAHAVPQGRPAEAVTASTEP
ncbi:Isoquinoline 1-oxidoreductase beta subunit [Rhodovulum sp. PH10]|uniref:molybdopterin cofactor-binding domain-containing protein n=1 Tax=Rhodovulum sp. PH10 TaxID=1187851 RepID=UPI00027C2341|nr:molybdopterin cofactor-binding domain-containing protein [Rhodovulum sp. PH10]EJW12331.1 Isoquinoline 1-oxidoreductase beta subunit [Rhodovulum sp. PH10]